jgi:hypothetical protein
MDNVTLRLAALRLISRLFCSDFSSPSSVLFMFSLLETLGRLRNASNSIPKPRVFLAGPRRVKEEREENATLVDWAAASAVKSA